MMWFAVLGFRADGQERILEMFLVQKGGFIKAQGQDPWARKSCTEVVRNDGLYTSKLGVGMDKGSFQEDFLF